MENDALIRNHAKLSFSHISFVNIIFMGYVALSAYNKHISTAYIFTVCRKLIAYGMYAQRKYLLFYRYVSPLFFFKCLSILLRVERVCQNTVKLFWRLSDKLTLLTRDIEFVRPSQLYRNQCPM